MTVLAVSKSPTGRKLYIGGRRVHHGLTGLALVALGAFLAAHDCADADRWAHDFFRDRM